MKGCRQQDCENKVINKIQNKKNSLHHSTDDTRVFLIDQSVWKFLYKHFHVVSDQPEASVPLPTPPPDTVAQTLRSRRRMRISSSWSASSATAGPGQSCPRWMETYTNTDGILNRSPLRVHYNTKNCKYRKGLFVDRISTLFSETLPKHNVVFWKIVFNKQ